MGGVVWVNPKPSVPPCSRANYAHPRRATFKIIELSPTADVNKMPSQFLTDTFTRIIRPSAPPIGVSDRRHGNPNKNFIPTRNVAKREAQHLNNSVRPRHPSAIWVNRNCYRSAGR
jgi:hypothetical protein